MIEQLSGISPALLLGKMPNRSTIECLGDFSQEAAKADGVLALLHRLRKAFCIYRAEQGISTHQNAAMAGHTPIGEVER